MNKKEALTQLEIMATNATGRLGEAKFEEEKALLNKHIEALDMAMDALKDYKPKTGRWGIEEIRSIYGEGYRLTCSECGDTFTVTENAFPHERYCRHCGAKMKKETMTKKEALTQLEIMATNATGRLGEAKFEEEKALLNKHIEALDMAMDALKDYKPKTGRWGIEEIRSIYGEGYRLTCSECGDTFTVSENAFPHERYCRHCGAKMKKETMTKKEALTQLEIMATNATGRLGEAKSEEEKALLNKHIEALNMGIDAIRWTNSLILISSGTVEEPKDTQGHSTNKKDMEALIGDINPREIASHIETNTLGDWCKILGSEMLRTLNKMERSKE